MPSARGGARAVMRSRRRASRRASRRAVVASTAREPMSARRTRTRTRRTDADADAREDSVRRLATSDFFFCDANSSSSSRSSSTALLPPPSRSSGLENLKDLHVGLHETPCRTLADEAHGFLVEDPLGERRLMGHAVDGDVVKVRVHVALSGKQTGARMLKNRREHALAWFSTT